MIPYKRLAALIVLVSIQLCTIISVAWYNYGYKVGQIDALQGNFMYEMRVDSAFVVVYKGQGFSVEAFQPVDTTFHKIKN